MQQESETVSGDSQFSWCKGCWTSHVIPEFFMMKFGALGGT